jgi:Xaa-Pro aminopeptidase
MAQGDGAAGPPYTGPIEPGMVFDVEPDKKHRYERLTITRKEGPQLWARGRCGETFHVEPEFRKSAVLVSRIPLAKPRPVPVPLETRYEGPLQAGMVFDFEPGKKHMYERLTITELNGSQIWARGRCGQTYYEERDFREHVVPVPGERR